MTIRGGAPGGRAPTGASDDLSNLLRRIATRDAAAFAALYKQTNAKLYGVVARILTRGDAAGCASGGLVRIWEKAANRFLKGLAACLDGDHARNRALDDARVRPVSLEDQPEGLELMAEEIDPLAARERSGARRWAISQALDEEKRARRFAGIIEGRAERRSLRLRAAGAMIKHRLNRSLAPRDRLAS
jgi:RNA polymerase sigma-70 factor (ECF subfamily)